MGPPRARHPHLKYFLVSWKMYPTVDEARSLLDAVQDGLRERAQAGARLPRVILCPPFVSIVPLAPVADPELLRLGAQNCHWEVEGPYTGEISARMLRGFAEYVMIGHSERRAMGETDEQIAGKVAAATAQGLVPILLVGEDDRGGDGIRVTEQRLRQGLSRVDADRDHVIVVYEPTWAIGANERAPAEHVGRSVAHLKEVLRELGSADPEIIYGGSVNEDNLGELMELGVLDGVGATSAALRPEGFLQIVDRLATG
ncbi:MAG: triose-phosphate isomerase [Actinomycetota bacterium]|nr:triose-phosphate isomerase [Actinomycetota bacterium]